jgi:ATP-dependent helicase/nuclease subunit B
MERLAAEGKIPLAGQVRDSLLAALEECFNQECADKEREMGLPNSREWVFLKAGLAMDLPAILASLLAAEAEGFHPVAFELPFGMGDREQGLVYCHPEPIPLELPEGETITLKGRIDRLEESAGPARALRVLDYKTGRPIREKDELRAGTALQRAIYLIAAAAITGIELDQLAASESGYVYVLNGNRRLIRGGPDFLARARSAVGAIVDGIRRGIFSPLPAALENRFCLKYCDYRDLCGPLRSALTDRLADDDPARTLRARLDAYE